MRAAVYHGPRDIRIEQDAGPEPGPRDVLVEVSRNGICGSDLHTYLARALGALVDDGLEALLHNADEHVKILVDPTI